MSGLLSSILRKTDEPQLAGNEEDNIVCCTNSVQLDVPSFRICELTSFIKAVFRAGYDVTFLASLL